MQIHDTPASRFIISRVLNVTGLCSLFKIQASGYKLRFHPSAVSMLLWCNPSFFERDEALIQSVLRPGDIFVDVGANIGALSLKASQIVGQSGRVFSIEAHPKTFKYLKSNIALNRASNIDALNAAAGDHEGLVHFTNRRSDDQNSVSKSGIQVPLRTLDSLIPDKPVRLLKIDVEGFELFVLRGAKTVLRHTDLVYFECYEPLFRQFGYSASDILNFLQREGFAVQLPPEYSPQKLANLLARRVKRN